MGIEEIGLEEIPVPLESIPESTHQVSALNYQIPTGDLVGRRSFGISYAGPLYPRSGPGVEHRATDIAYERIPYQGKAL